LRARVPRIFPLGVSERIERACGYGPYP
jgi:hypothetical protein